MKVKITFIEPLLGTLAGNKELAEEFIASKHPSKEVQEDEAEAIANLPEQIEKSSTLFPRHKGEPFIWDYQIKGFFKDACSMLNRVGPKMKAHKKIIDGLIFVKPRRIILALGGELTWTERPLRAQTAQGERIALARSETAPIGTTLEFEINCLDKKLETAVKYWLDYGALRGLGQWRNSGMGRFEWIEVQ